MRWDINALGWRKQANEAFNQRWITSHRLIPEARNLDQLQAEGLNTDDAQAHQIGWLKNIDRLIDMAPASFDPGRYQLVDAGCGSGIATLYYAENVGFKTIRALIFPHT